MVRYAEGTLVWIPDKESVWQKGEIVEIGSNSIKIRTEDETTVALPIGKPVHLRNDELFSSEGLVGLDDLTQLMHLHEAAVLHSLNVRFDIDKIYTFTGPILIAVNPFKYITGMYEFQTLKRYTAVKPSRAPHVFATANAAYRGICERKRSQTILISGESGAGKTESTKHVMKFLALAASPEESRRSKVEKQVLESNPLLEAFGNARTLRNDNSSRFGKFIELQFKLERDRERGGELGRVCGARIHTYLLEKVRVCDQQEGERNFHIFYQLCAAASRGCDDNGTYHFPQYIKEDDVRPEALDLRAFASHDQFMYLTRSSCFELDNVDDVEQFERTVYAMQTVGIDVEDQMNIFRVVGAVLYLGNIYFRHPQDNSEGAEVAPGAQDAMRRACELLGVQPAALEETLCYRLIRTKTENYMKPLNIHEAEDARDALARALYGSLFLRIVHRTNISIGYNDSVKLMCGVLDIFGFECFKLNSFEQICINFTNERLQHFFNTFVFKCEEELYRKENIPWDPLDFPDNQDCVDTLQERRTGIFSMLDEECMVPQGSDRGFCNKIIKQHAKNPRFGIIKTEPSWFTVNHFAGPVHYCSDSFLDKNKDHLSTDVQECIKTSNNPFVASLFREHLHRGEVDEGSSSSSGRGAPEPAKKRGIKRPVTVSSEFRDQLNDLMNKIDTTEPHFIRCIKPNPQNAPDDFHRLSVTEQLRYGGVLQAVQVSRAGYPVRFPHRDCFDDYKVLAKHAMLRSLTADMDARTRAHKLLEHLEEDLPIPKVQHSAYSWAVGKTLCFLKQEAFEALQSARLKLRSACAVKIQAVFKGRRERRSYVYLQCCVLQIQALMRGKIARMEAQRRRQDRAVRVIQRVARGFVQRIRYQRTLFKIVLIQSWWRGIKGRELAANWRVHCAASVIQASWKMSKQRAHYVQLRAAACVFQRRWRVKAAKRQLRRLRQEAKEVGNLLVRIQALMQENADLKQTKSDMEVHALQREDHLRHLVDRISHLEGSIRDKEDVIRQKDRELEEQYTRATHRPRIVDQPPQPPAAPPAAAPAAVEETPVHAPSPAVDALHPSPPEHTTPPTRDRTDAEAAVADQHPAHAHAPAHVHTPPRAVTVSRGTDAEVQHDGHSLGLGSGGGREVRRKSSGAGSGAGGTPQKSTPRPVSHVATQSSSATAVPVPNAVAPHHHNLQEVIERVRAEVAEEMQREASHAADKHRVQRAELETENADLKQQLAAEQQELKQLQSRYHHLLMSSVGSSTSNPHNLVQATHSSQSHLHNGPVSPDPPHINGVVATPPSQSSRDNVMMEDGLTSRHNVESPVQPSAQARQGAVVLPFWSSDTRSDILLVGAPGAGKTQLLESLFEKMGDTANLDRLRRERFTTDPTVTLVYFNVTMDGYAFRILDCPASDFMGDPYESIIKPQFRRSRWAVILYDMSKLDTYQAAVRALDEARHSGVNFLLFGNKWSHKNENASIEVDLYEAKDKAASGLGLSVESDDLSDAFHPIIGDLKTEARHTGMYSRVNNTNTPQPNYYRAANKPPIGPSSATAPRRSTPARLHPPHTRLTANPGNRSRLATTLENMRSWFRGEEPKRAVGNTSQLLVPSLYAPESKRPPPSKKGDHSADVMPVQQIELKSPSGQASAVTCLALGRERKKKPYFFLAIGTKEGQITVYRVYRTPLERDLLRRHQSFGAEYNTVSPDELSDADRTAGEAEFHIDLVGHKRAVTSLRFSPLEDFIFSTSIDKSTRFFDPDTGECLKVFADGTPALTAAFLPLNLNVIIIANTNSVLRLVNATNGGVIQKLKFDTEVRAMQFDDTSCFCFAGTKNGVIHVLEATDSSTLKFKFKQALSNRNRAAITCINYVSSTTPERNPYILVNSCDNFVSIVDCIYGEPSVLTNLTVRHRVKVAHSLLPIGSCYSGAGGGFVVSGSEDKEVYLYSLDPHNNYRLQNLAHVHQAPVLAVASNFVDTLLISGDSAGVVFLWRRLEYTEGGN